jgi:hypothetical protein
MLFIVLAANIELGAFLSAVTLPSLAVLAILIFIVRPLGVFLSSVGSPLTTPEKLYLSWIAPRGIVAAAVSSLFASKLTSAGLEGADGLVPLVFVVIVGTVLLASLTARPLGVRLGVADPDPQGFLILGAHALARNLGTALRDQGVPVLLADTNWSNVTAARADGLPAYYGSLLSDRSDDELRLSGIGRLLALTSNDEANALTALKYGREFGTNNVYQLAPGRSRNERRRLGGERRGRLLGGEDVTYGRMQQLLAAGAEVKRTDLTERFDFDAFLQRYGEDALPLFAVEAKRVRVLSDRSTPPEAGSAVIAVVRDRRAQAPTGGGGEGTPATEPADHDTRSTGAGPADVGGPAA